METARVLDKDKGSRRSHRAAAAKQHSYEAKEPVQRALLITTSALPALSHPPVPSRAMEPQPHASNYRMGHNPRPYSYGQFTSLREMCAYGAPKQSAQPASTGYASAPQLVRPPGAPGGGLQAAGAVPTAAAVEAGSPRRKPSAAPPTNDDRPPTPTMCLSIISDGAGSYVQRVPQAADEAGAQCTAVCGAAPPSVAQPVWQAGACIMPQPHAGQHMPVALGAQPAVHYAPVAPSPYMVAHSAQVHPTAQVHMHACASVGVAPAQIQPAQLAWVPGPGHAAYPATLVAVDQRGSAHEHERAAPGAGATVVPAYNGGAPPSATNGKEKPGNELINGKDGSKDHPMLSFVKVAKTFHLPIEEAARVLGVCTSIIKRVCRANGVQRWPYRKIHSLSRRIATLEEEVQNGSATSSHIRELATLKSRLQRTLAGDDDDSKDGGSREGGSQKRARDQPNSLVAAAALAQPLPVPPHCTAP